MIQRVSFLSGQRIGRYQVLRLLGEGLSAEVYVVHDPELARDAALKISSSDAHFDVETPVEDEACLLSSLRHPRIVDIWDAGHHEGRAYFVMDLLDHSLSDELRGGILTLERCVYWLHGVALALDHLHRRGVLHLDVHADNIFLDRLGDVRLTDFGAARAPGVTVVASELHSHAPASMAPELLANDAVGAYTDVWGLGVVMYQLLAGRVPFESHPNPQSQHDIADRIKATSRLPPPPSTFRPGLPAALDALCLSCLAKDVDRRERDAGAIARRLKPWEGRTSGSRVFISHAEADRERVEREVIRVLESHGFRTWYCREDVRSASLWERAILDALEASDWFLVVMTPASMQSEWVKDEVHWAIDHRPGRILPVMLDRCDPAGFHIRLRRLQSIDLRDDDGSKKMLSALTVAEQT